MNNGPMVAAKEKEMWDAVITHNVPAFKQLVSADAVMLCGGLKCSGLEYAGFVSDFNINAADIHGMTVTYADDDCVHLHYIVATSVDGADNDLFGKFYVTSFWTRTQDGWTLIFNMDSRINDN